MSEHKQASRRARKLLNQAFLVRICLDRDSKGLRVANDHCTEPVTRLHDLPFTQNEAPALSGRG
jgi:hypothetical protein